MAEYLIKDTTLTGIADAIRAKNGGTDPIAVTDMAAQIAAITGGGGSSDDVRYVTFMSYDGTVEYGKKAVAVGDDCADPIARGVFDTPTRESTEQYNYTFYGWATEVNGGADANALKAVTEDRTVYANFSSTLRTYIITFYDDDGTVLKSTGMAYGSYPSYTPTKDGYTFNGWQPALATVTGDAEYTAQWIAKLDFNTLTWAQIAEYAESGEAANVFEIGAKKTFSTKQNVSMTAEIIGFNHDNLADGSGKAGITLKINQSFNKQYPNTEEGAAWGSSISQTKYYNMSWDDCDTRTAWNNSGAYYPLQYVLPDNLVAVIKQVSKKYHDIPNNAVETTNDYLWLPSLSELGFTAYGDHGECYEAYTPNKVASTNYEELIEYNNGSACVYATRSKASSYISIPCISASGAYTTVNQSFSTTFTFPHFCI